MSVLSENSVYDGMIIIQWKMLHYMHEFCRNIMKVVHEMSTGAKIKRSRMAAGMSQRELAKSMGYSNHSTIARIESNKVDIPQSKLIQFAEVLNVSVAFLLGFEEKVRENEDDLLRLSVREFLSSKKTGNRLEHVQSWFDELGGVEFTDEEHYKLIEYAKYLLYLREQK